MENWQETVEAWPNYTSWRSWTLEYTLAERRVTGFIDWDFAEPGAAITDLAKMAYYFVPLRGESGWQEAGFAERPDLLHRLDLLCMAYGQFTANEVIDEVRQWLHEEQKRTIQLGRKGVEPWTRFLQRGDDKMIQHDLVWLESLSS